MFRAMFKFGFTLKGLVTAAQRMWPNVDTDVLKEQIVWFLKELESEGNRKREVYRLRSGPSLDDNPPRT